MTNRMRYSRQMLLPEIGSDGQHLLSAATVVIVGVGGIGSTAAMYLAGAGVENIHLVDFDVVELSNLHRQLIHEEATVGEAKVLSAKNRLNRFNSSVRCTATAEKLTHDNCIRLLEACDVVVDASDNMDVRYVLSDACVLLKKPLVSGAAIGMSGQLTVLCAADGPCYRCVHPMLMRTQSCSDRGVLGPVPGLIGCLEAIEAIKLLLSTRGSNTNSNHAPAMDALVNRQCVYDGYSGEFHTFDLGGKRKDCACCGENAVIKTIEDSRASLQDMQQQQLAMSFNPLYSLLPPEWNMDAKLFQNILQQQQLDEDFLVLDVRSEIQFRIASWVYYATIDTSTPERQLQQFLPAMRKLVSAGRYIHIPLASLLRMSKEETTQRLQLPSSLARVFVLCRRGVDSTAATRWLREQVQVTALNIAGGLTAWAATVDPLFPMY